MVHKPKRKVPIAPAQMIKRPFPKQSDELMPLGEVTSPFLSSYMCRNLCWKQFILEIWHRADYTQHRAPVFSAPTRLRDYFPSLPCMQIQLPGFTFRSLKAGPQTQVENDKSLRSSHFSAKTILQCVDSALPPLPTFGGRSGPQTFLCWDVLLTVGQKRFGGVCVLQVGIQVQTHTREHITSRPDAHTLEVGLPGVALVKGSPLFP